MHRLFLVLFVLLSYFPFMPGLLFTQENHKNCLVRLFLFFPHFSSHTADAVLLLNLNYVGWVENYPAYVTRTVIYTWNRWISTQRIFKQFKLGTCWFNNLQLPKLIGFGGRFVQLGGWLINICWHAVMAISGFILCIIFICLCFPGISRIWNLEVYV